MPEADLHSRHVSAVKSRLVHLAGLGERTATAEKAILAAAVNRRKAVNADLDTLRSKVNLDDDAAERYQALILERGKIDTVIAASQAALPDHRP